MASIKNTLFSGLFAVGLILFLFGCTGGQSGDGGMEDGSGDGGGEGAALSIYLTNKSLDQDMVESVWINIKRVEMHIEELGWLIVKEFDQPKEFDLFKLKNGTKEEVASFEGESFHLTQIRLVLDENNEISLVSEIERRPLITPSAQQSGVKASVDVTTSQGTTTAVTLEFDAGLSINVVGNDSYLLNPTIKVSVDILSN